MNITTALGMCKLAAMVQSKLVAMEIQFSALEFNFIYVASVTIMSLGVLQEPTLSLTPEQVAATEKLPSDSKKPRAGPGSCEDTSRHRERNRKTATDLATLLSCGLYLVQFKEKVNDDQRLGFD